MLQDLLKANAAYLSRPTPPAPGDRFAGPARKLAVVTCMDARLVGILPAALGLETADAIFIRNAGNTITRWDESILRSVAAAVYLQNVRHVAVVGHTDCRMAGNITALADGLRRAGVSRDALGDRDLREWFGAIGSIEGNVRNVVDALKRSPLLPAGIGLYGLILDTESGTVRVVTDATTEVVASSRTAPRPLESLEKVLGSKSTPAFVPSSYAAPVTVAAPAVAAMPAAAMMPAAVASPAASAAPQAPAVPVRPPASTAQRPAAPPQPKPAPRPETRRPETMRSERRDAIPMDPREAQEFFRQREQERLKKKGLY